MTDSFLIDSLTLADRSTLENFAECPRMARALETGAVLNANGPTEAGSAGHHAISSTVTAYVDSQGMMNVTELAEYMRAEVAASRPDIQPEAVAALRSSFYGISRLLKEIHPLNIMRWDGGPGDKSGQLSHDYEDLGVRCTSELDLINSNRRTEVITVTDWKTGHEWYTASKVADSFQFQMHAWLLFHNYPNVQVAEFRVWMTRFNSVTPPATFKRDEFFELDHRIRSAAVQFAKWRDKTPEECAAWPLVEKCAGCRFAAQCDMSGLPDTTPEEIVEKIALLGVVRSALEDAAAQYVAALGRDIQSPSGQSFGFGKPKRQTKPKMALYSSGKQEPEGE